MAKPTAPLLSFGASGTIAKTAVYSRWKGRPYVRRHVIPANPQSAAQTSTRDVFRTANAIWKVAGPLLQAPWDRFAQGQVLTGRNAFVGQFVEDERGKPDLTTMTFSPGAKGGLPPAAISLTPASTQITVDFTNPTPPTGWTIAAAVACAIIDGDPETLTDFTTVEGEDTSTFNQVVLTGLTDSELYVVGAWLRWTKPDLSIAYGASLSDTATPS